MVNDPTGDERPRHRPLPPAHGRDDAGPSAAADVRAILARALGLRRIVELAAEVGAGRPDGLTEAARAWPRPRPS